MQSNESHPPSAAEQESMRQVTDGYRQLREALAAGDTTGMREGMSALMRAERTLARLAGCSCDSSDGRECCHGVCSSIEFAPAELTEPDLLPERALALVEYGQPCDCRCHRLGEQARSAGR